MSLLAVLAVVCGCLALGRLLHCLGARFGSVGFVTRLALLSLGASLAPFAVSKYTNSPPDDAYGPAPLRTLVAETGETDEAATKTFAVTAFSVDTAQREVAFGFAWTDGLFDDIGDSGVDVFMSTNLLSRTWIPLTRLYMPWDTNEFETVIDEWDVDYDHYDTFTNSFSRMAFFSFGLQVDSDGDGITDCDEMFIHHTDPQLSDTDGDGVDDDDELWYGLDPATDEFDLDTDGDGLTDFEELFQCRTDRFENDTDGDGLGDFDEINVHFTDPLYLDTDGDGLPDGWEIQWGFDPLSGDGDDGSDGDPDGDGLVNRDECEFGADPWTIDTDGDGLTDIQEVGGIVAADVLRVTPLSAVDLTSDFSDEDGSVVVWTLPSPVWMQGVCVSNVSIDVDGVVFFNRAGTCQSNGIGTGCPLDGSWTLCEDALAVAPYWDDLCLLERMPASSVSVGVVLEGTNRFYVIQYANARPHLALYDLPGDADSTVSWQLVFPAGEVEEMSIRYDDVSGNMDGRYASIGFQSFGGARKCQWSYCRQGAVVDGMALKLILGAHSNPNLQDTDGDGLDDLQERRLGTDPSLPDTDGDGMNDRWELIHADPGFDPLVRNVNDEDAGTGPDDDLDGDGLTNRDESEWDTDPSAWDTDGDGVDDGSEVDGGADPADGVDQALAQWFYVTGDLEKDEVKSETCTFTIPAGRTFLACVFLASEEYPTYTGQRSKYNDVVTWHVEGGGASGSSSVNALDPSWDAAKASGHSIGVLSPVVLQDARFISAPTNEELEVSVTLTAKNVGDDILPSTVALGLFPLRIEQRNMPASTGGGDSTDAGTTSSALISDFGVAYITGAPAAADLVARIKDLPEWLRVTWETMLTSEREERNALDDRMASPVELRGTADYLISAELRNEIVGGRCALTVKAGNFQPKTVQFYIRGKNPLDVTARAYIDANVDAEFRDFAWMIAKHESRDAVTGQVYNQFNASGRYKEMPNRGAPDGWGICQIDRSGNKAGIRYTTTAETYNWHENVAAMAARLAVALSNAQRFVGYYRSSYSSLPNWTEPPSTNVNGVTVLAETWAVLVLYNGTGGVPRQSAPTAPRRFRSPLEFEPATGRWIFHSNTINPNYVRDVVSHAYLTEVE